MSETGQKAGTDHKRKHTREQGITNFKQAEVAMAEGSIVAEATWKIGGPSRPSHHYQT